MSKCHACGNDLPVNATFCSHCGVSAHSSVGTAVSNPYQVSDAVLDTGGAAPTEAMSDGEFEYNVMLGVGPIVGTIFNAWSGSLPKLMLVALVPLLPMTVLGIVAVVLIAISATSPGSIFRNFNFDKIANIDAGVAIVAVVVLFVVAFVAVGIPAFIGQMRILDEKARVGEHMMGAWEAYWSSFRYVPPLLGMIFIVYLALIVVAVPAAFLVKIPIAMGLYILVAAIFITIASIRICMAIPCMVFEKQSIFSAIAESNRLVKGHVWTVVGILGVMFVVMLGIGLVVGGMSLIPIIGQLANLGANLALTPLQAASIWAIYAGLKTPQKSSF